MGNHGTGGGAPRKKTAHKPPDAQQIPTARKTNSEMFRRTEGRITGRTIGGGRFTDGVISSGTASQSESLSRGTAAGIKKGLNW